MSHTPRKMKPGLPPVKVRVSFYPPDPVHLTLQGPSLQAYYEWRENPSYENEEELEEAIYDQCETHVLQWTTLKEWEVKD